MSIQISTSTQCESARVKSFRRTFIIFDMNEANRYPWRKPTYKLLQSIPQAYGINDLTLPSLHRVVSDFMVNDPAYLYKYCVNYFKGAMPLRNNCLDAVFASRLISEITCTKFCDNPYGLILEQKYLANAKSFNQSQMNSHR